jgi:SAM-dependent methyltransferase
MDLPSAIAEHDWYHTLELAPGVVTPGWQDTRPVAPSVPFGDLTGARCLDVGTFDGFWAFEMERRGGTVSAIDILDPERWDWPHGSEAEVKEVINQRKAGGRGFELAREALDSRVEREECSVYDLDPAVHGTFDLVYVGSLLLHLRDPVGALEAVRGVCGGRLIVVDGIDLWLSLVHPRRAVANFDGRGRPWWWHVNETALSRLVESAGFTVTAGPDRVYVPAGPGRPTARWAPRLLASREGRQALIHSWRGDPHAVVVARPR